MTWDARLWGALLVVCGVIFLDGLDVSMVGMSLPSIGADLGVSLASLQWVVTGYVLGYGGLLLLGGRTADLLGRRRVFLIALAVFAVVSMLSSLATNPELLIAARFVKGVAAAFTAPAALSIITTTFHEGPDRNRALSIFTTCAASGFSMGLILGGALTEVGWRWTFLAPGPVALIVLLFAIKLIPNSPRDDAAGGYDVPGAITVTGGMLSLVYAVVGAEHAGWVSVQTIGLFALAAVLLAGFVAIEQRTKHPLVRLGILRNASLRRANLAILTVFGSYVAFQLIGTLYLQNLLGWSSFETALGFLPAGLLVATLSPNIGKVVDRVGTEKMIIVAMALFVAGYALSLRIGPESAYFSTVFPTIMLLGLGFAIGFPSLNIQAVSGVPDHEQGLASGLFNTSNQVGGAVVLAIVTAVISSQTAGVSAPTGVLSAYKSGLGVVTGIAALGLVIALSGLRGLKARRAAEEREAAELAAVQDELAAEEMTPAA
ncbi:MFS transporter [Kribbella shirazensis]|uniref:EmrB/QacA subfamily drug resistance transporter n=1 Tax=Kribbella shirazensis TaxID=1105143 RepID=A0A7X6A1D0_9ACTN|nr:MFS transporter [Kribbella shirazensis]NIK57049.1 EmrB/QacA subfamily drug resistance transporter [Kribbella shirazensis]